MGAGFDDASGVEHQDPVGSSGLAEPVGDDESSAVAQHLVGCPVEFARARAPGVRGGLVENGDAGIEKDESRERELLALGRGQPIAAFADHGAKRVGQRVDPPASANAVEGGEKLVVRGAGSGEAQVVGE